MTTALRDESLISYFELIKKDQPDVARIRIKKFLSQHPKNGRAAFLFGLAYHHEKEYAQAEPWFQKAIELTPEYLTTYYFCGWCLYYLGELDEARAKFDVYVQHRPEVGDAVHALGLIALDLGDLETAEKRFREAIDLQQDDPALRADLARSHIFLGEVLAHLDRIEEARDQLEKSIEIWPIHEEAYYQLSLVRTRLGDEEGAAEAQRQYEEVKERVEQMKRAQPTRPASAG